MWQVARTDILCSAIHGTCAGVDLVGQALHAVHLLLWPQVAPELTRPELEGVGNSEA